MTAGVAARHYLGRELVLTRSHVWAVVLNEDSGHPQIVRFRVEAPGGP